MAVNIYGVVNGVSTALPMVTLLGAAYQLLGMDATGTQLEYKNAFYNLATGQFYTTGGTVAAPAQSFSAELGSGRYRVGAGSFAESLLGSLAWTWSNSASLGHQSSQRLTMLAKLFQEAKSADVNAGATVDVDGLTGNYGYVNNAAGATTVTGMGGATVPAGTEIELKFVITGGSVTLQNNGVSFLMLGAADIALQTGDVCRFRKINSAQAYWEMVSFQRGISLNQTLQNLTVLGNTQLGDAGADTLTIYPNAVTWVNNPTHSGNHTFSGTLTVNGATSTFGSTLFQTAAGVGVFGSPSTALHVYKAAVGASVIARVENTSNTASAKAGIEVIVAGGTADDPYQTFTVVAGGQFVIGIDNSDNDRFKLSSGGLLGTNDILTFFASGRTGVNATASGLGLIEATHSGTPSPVGIAVNFTGADPNNTASTFFTGFGLAVERFTARSNGGLANFSANNVNLSDVEKKNSITPMPSLWNNWRAIAWVKYKLNDQTHSDWNFGYTAQNIRDAFAGVADELVDYWDPSEDIPEAVSKIKVFKTIKETVLVDGVYTLQERQIEVEEPEMEDHLVFNPDGTAVMIEAVPAVYEPVKETRTTQIKGTDAEGNEVEFQVPMEVVIGTKMVEAAKFVQAVHQVPKMVPSKRKSEALAVYDHDLGNIGGKVLQEAQERIEALEALVTKLAAKVGLV